MNILIETYNPEWPAQFERIKQELETILEELNPSIEHIGSTSVPGLAAKPIIDVMVGLESVMDLDKTIQPMMENHYIYYELFNKGMPDRRLYVGLKNPRDIQHFKPKYTENDVVPHEEIHPLRLSHVHIWEYGTPAWVRHLAFRDYLRAHPEVAREYGELKRGLGQKPWRHGMEYNDAKNDFVKKVERDALAWYRGL